jgi:hypothetical protein
MDSGSTLHPFYGDRKGYSGLALWKGLQAEAVRHTSNMKRVLGPRIRRVKCDSGKRVTCSHQLWIV